MTAAKILPVLATHGGKFHCDEVFAYVVLKLALALKAPGQLTPSPKLSAASSIRRTRRWP